MDETLHPETPTLATQRLTLRARGVSDAQTLFAAMSKPEVMQWWSRAPFENIGDLEDYFADKNQGIWRAWAIIETGSEEAIGFVSAGETRQGVSEIGYLLVPEATGRGLAREAVSAIIDQLFLEGQRRIFADIDPDNLPSSALLQALGFKQEGHLREEWNTHLGIRDSHIYGLLKREWQS